MWYLHKLMDDDLVNHITVTRYDIDYNCEHVCLGRSESKSGLYMDLYRLQGPVKYGTFITPEGRFDTAGEVADAAGLSLTRGRKIIQGCRNWTRQWPPGWSENGVRGPRIRLGRILHVGDKHFWEAYCFDDIVTYDEKKALHWAKDVCWGTVGHKKHYDYKAYVEALKSGSGFPDGTGCISNCVYYGDEFTYDELEKLDLDLYRSIV